MKSNIVEIINLRPHLATSELQTFGFKAEPTKPFVTQPGEGVLDSFVRCVNERKRWETFPTQNLSLLRRVIAAGS